MADTDERAAVAERAARAGARVANDRFRSDIDVETKGDDVVTEADRAAQRTVIESIRETFPDDAIVGEEEDERKTVPETGAAWVIDPIDGTSNYVRDIRVWGPRSRPSSTANRSPRPPVAPALGRRTPPTRTARTATESMCVSDVSNPRRATVDPTLWWDFDSRDEYAAAACEAIVRRFSDLRRFGAAQIVLPTVAAGGLEGTISNLRANPWDSVAGVFMVRQAGESDGYRGEPLATRLNRARRLERNLHDEVLDAARAIEGLD